MTVAELWTSYLWPLIVIVAQSLLLLILLLVSIAYVLLADRKIWAAVQMRRGPNVVGPWGLLQSFADLLKFVFKEPVIPSGSNKGVFLLAPLVTCTLALAAWALRPKPLAPRAVVSTASSCLRIVSSSLDVSSIRSKDRSLLLNPCQTTARMFGVAAQRESVPDGRPPEQSRPIGDAKAPED